MCSQEDTNKWRCIPIGRGSGLKIRSVWIRVPPPLPCPLAQWLEPATYNRKTKVQFFHGQPFVL